MVKSSVRQVTRSPLVNESNISETCSSRKFNIFPTNQPTNLFIWVLLLTRDLMIAMSLKFCNSIVMNQFKNFLSTGAMVDVTLNCDGGSLKAHKIILSANSLFFKSLFLKNPCKHPIVILKDMKYSELKLVIDFMYCGEVIIAENQLSAFIKIAQTLRVKGLGEVKLLNNQSNSETENSSDNGSENPTGNTSRNQSGNKFCFKWNNNTIVMYELKNFLSSEIMVDVTLGCDGQSLKAHKIVLSAYSSFFRSLFLENSCKHPIVILKDMKYTELKSVIDFMYSSEKITEDQLSSVIKTAQTLKVKGLMDMESQRSLSSHELENPVGDDSNNQSSDELSHQPVGMIDVSNWTIMQKQSLSEQNVDGSFVPEIKQEVISDDDDGMEVGATCTKTSTASLPSSDANSSIKSETDQTVEQDAPEESFDASACNNIFEQILMINDLPKQPFQSEMEPHEECTDNTSNLVPVASTVDDNQEPKTSSASARKSPRKKKKLIKIPAKSKVINNRRRFILDFILTSLRDHTFGDNLIWDPKDHSMFLLKWTHKRRSTWSEEDAAMFVAWDLLKGRKPAENSIEFVISKERFRAALESEKAIQLVPSFRKSDYRRYKMLEPCDQVKRRKGAKKSAKLVSSYERLKAALECKKALQKASDLPKSGCQRRKIIGTEKTSRKYRPPK